jgi:hypothetical protein
MIAEVYWDVADLARLFRVSLWTVKKWRTRYRHTEHPFPDPDRYYGRSPVWRRDREPELHAWFASRLSWDSARPAASEG